MSNFKWRNKEYGVTLYNGDCLELMQLIKKESIHMVLADPPYGTTACKWDSIIPLEPMWEQLKRVAKKDAAIVMTASQPFTSKLVMSNPGMFKYCWVWQKSKATGFQDVKYRPLKQHEDVIVFSSSGCSTGSKPAMKYIPQGVLPCNKPRTERKAGGFFRSDCSGGGTQTLTNWPKSILQFNSQGKSVHPTQKPVDLMAYLIRTYTNEGDTVLDFTMGSGTTGVACVKEGRKFVGIELDENYYNISVDRISKEIKERS